jgi:hypothetical protein
MRVVISEATLKRHRACRGRYDSPYWSEEEKSLVYENWDEAVAHFLSTKDGTERLEWLVNHELVPMTKDQFSAVSGASNG